MTPQDYCWEQVSRWDRARGLALRYAPLDLQELGLAVLAFNLELARVMPQASEAALADIRFMWWREALDELEQGKIARNHPVVQALEQVVNRAPDTMAPLRALLEGWQDMSRREAPLNWDDLSASLEATHGRLAGALLSLVSGLEPAPSVARNYALAWGYGSLRHAVLRSADLGLLPLHQRQELASAVATDAEQVRQAAQLLASQAQQAYAEFRPAWRTLLPAHKGLLASAHLIPARLEDVERADGLAAWHLFLGRVRSQFWR